MACAIRQYHYVRVSAAQSLCAPMYIAMIAARQESSYSGSSVQRMHR